MCLGPGQQVSGLVNCIRANWVVVAVPHTRQLNDAVCNTISRIEMYTKLCRSKFTYIYQHFRICKHGAAGAGGCAEFGAGAGASALCGRRRD